jgi:hypothetical protein
MNQFECSQRNSFEEEIMYLKREYLHHRLSRSEFYTQLEQKSLETHQYQQLLKTNRYLPRKSN